MVVPSVASPTKSRSLRQLVSTPAPALSGAELVNYIVSLHNIAGSRPVVVELEAGCLAQAAQFQAEPAAPGGGGGGSGHRACLPG